jgi:hypothetical protein
MEVSDRPRRTPLDPTFAPSITARAGTNATAPPAAKPATIRPVAVLLLKNGCYTQSSEKLSEAVAQPGAEPAPQIETEAAP